MKALIHCCAVIFGILCLSMIVNAEDFPLDEMQKKINEHEDSVYDKDKEIEKREKEYRETMRELKRKEARQCFESRSDYQACLGDRGADIQKAQWAVDSAIKSLDSAEASSEAAKVELADVLERYLDYKEKFYRENKSKILQSKWNEKLAVITLERKEIAVFKEKFNVIELKRWVRQLETELQKAEHNLNSKKERPCIESRNDYQACIADRGADIQRAQWRVDEEHKKLEARKRELESAEDEFKYSKTSLKLERERVSGRY